MRIQYMGCNDASPIGVIGFQGALSPLVADTRKRAAAAEFGELVSVVGMIPRERVLLLPRALEVATLDLSPGGFMFATAPA
jgi:hypothetical protein